MTTWAAISKSPATVTPFKLLIGGGFYLSIGSGFELKIGAGIGDGWTADAKHSPSWTPATKNTPSWTYVNKS